jgi:hypothetical protein
MKKRRLRFWNIPVTELLDDAVEKAVKADAHVSKSDAKHVCPNCGSRDTIFIPETGEKCCPNCGLVRDKRGIEAKVLRAPSGGPSMEIDEIPEFKVLNCCPFCGNSDPKNIYPNWPREGLIHCNVCHKHWGKENFYLQAKKVEHPAQTPSVCPKCGSIHIEKDPLKHTPFIAYIHGYKLIRLECFNCGSIFWYVLRPKLICVEPVKSWWSKSILSSYGDYKQRFKNAVQGPINYPVSDILTPISETHYKIKTQNEEGDVVIHLPGLIRKRFQEYYMKEKYAVSYAKSERQKNIFEKTIPYHWAFRLFEHNKLIYEECLRLASKLIHINKQGKNWNYLALAIVHIVLFLHNLRTVMPDMPKLWKQQIGRTFHWKTYRRHLEFVVAHTQPYVRNGVLMRKKTGAWVEQLMLWLEGEHQPIV